ncbi:MAG: hypothetical protein HLX50_08960 [Alteromonadaceae bacterium]|nr:hypothetical protein [Alteromonadaceae bacterium]
MALKMRSQWNDAEDGALQGLSPEAQVIYLRGFRRYMNYATGVAGGPARKLSYKALGELISVEPDWGSQRRRGDSPTLGRVRARVAELERAGLVVNHGSCRRKGLVFKLPLADVGLVRSEKEQHWEQHKEQHRKPHSGNVVNLPKKQELMPIEREGNNAGNNTGSNARNNTHQVTTTVLNSTDAGAREAGAWSEDYVPQKPEEWGSFLGRERHWAYHRVARPKLIITYQRWVAHQLTIGDMRHIIGSAEATLGRVPDGPEYYARFAESYWVERDRQQQEIRNQQHRGTHGRGSEHSPHRSERDERAAVRRQLSDPDYAMQHW